MTRDEWVTVRMKAANAVKALFDEMFNANRPDEDYMTPLEAAKAAHEVACRELDMLPMNDVPFWARDSIALAVEQLDTAVNDSVMPKEHIRIAMRYLLEVLSRQNPAAAAEASAGKEGFPP